MIDPDREGALRGRRRTATAALARVALLACALCLAAPALARAQESEAPADIAAWAEFDYLKSLLEPDARLEMLQAPVFHFDDREIRATYAFLWVEPDAPSFWTDTRPSDLRVRAPAAVEREEEGPVAATGFGDMMSRPELATVRELYLEGPVEFFRGGERVAVAEAIYIDRIDGHGWIADGRIDTREKIGGSRFVFKVRADWLRISEDGSLRSDNARITTCEHEQPHYYLRTDELRMTPTGDDEFPWRISLQGNRLRIADTITLPLPPINYLADEDGEPALRNLRVGDSARYGPTVGFGYARDLRDFGRGINRLLSGNPDNFRAKFRVDASYLGSRGLLVDLGLRLRSEGHYRIDTYLGLIPDGDEDKGLVRVDEGDRDTLRTWLRTRGRFNVSAGSWVDVVVSDQSDAGVQAEFFEDDYLTFEERESYLHWRKAWGPNYASATAAAAIDGWRTEVEELPEVNYARQRTTIAHIAGAPLVWGARASAGWYRRQEGNPLYEQPFADGFGEEETWRGDASHRLELPIPVAGGAARLIPFADVRGTIWSEAAGPGDTPTRGALLVGAELTATLWRRTQRGGLIELAPTFGIVRDASYDQSGGVPIPLDATEEDLEGTFFDVGLRARLEATRFPLRFDAEVRSRRALELPHSAVVEWRPVNVLAGLTTSIGSVPVRVFHDGRYDLESERTDYARTRVSFEPLEDLRIDASFTVARADAPSIADPSVVFQDVKIVEAAGLGAVYRFSPKWEFEVRQTVNLVSSKALDSTGIVRRYGHDVVVEYFVSERSGEGGTSFGISIKPTITANRRPPVLLPSSDFAD